MAHEPLALDIASMPRSVAFVVVAALTAPQEAPVPHLKSEQVTAGLALKVIGNVQVQEP